MEQEVIQLKCEQCGCDYEKPMNFLWYSQDGQPSLYFYKRCLTYCDKCRREKEREMLKHLPEVIKALSKSEIK